VENDCIIDGKVSSHSQWVFVITLSLSLKNVMAIIHSVVNMIYPILQFNNVDN
jgi:hypothetical protein